MTVEQRGRLSVRSVYVVTMVLAVAPTSARAEIQHALFQAGSAYVRVEVLRDDIVHIEAAAGTGQEAGAIYASPMVFRRDYAGPRSYSREGNRITTSRLRLEVDAGSLCIDIYDTKARSALTAICPQDLSRDQKTLTLRKGAMTHAYGLGQQFKQLGSADGDWTRFGSRDSSTVGNEFVGFGQAGMVGNIQIPILFALGPGKLTYGLLLDNVYEQTWSFSADPWRVTMYGDQVRFYVVAGEDLPAARMAIMELVGTPPVPPRKAFGLWVSEFGYRNWGEIDTLAKGLRRDDFPVDGFVLDLFWFGGIKRNDVDSPMGRLAWDNSAFPDAAATIARLAADHLGLVAIEESYIGKNTDTYAAMSTDRLLAYAPTNGRCDAQSYQPVILDDWFGKGGMVDWSNGEAGAWVHDFRREPNLVRPGILGHWTDLGEPERYDAGACYKGVETTAAGEENRHADIHNLYAFLWNRSIYDGYYRHRETQNRRPFMLSRSGAAGSQRFGVAMWSGDIGSNLDILASHFNAQLHMSLSGIDYYGADTGGFRREGLPCNEGHRGQLQYQDELYTQWLANAAWLDVPVRPHTDNSFQTAGRYPTAPNLVGTLADNRDNLRRRYVLLPYYYSLAHRAYLYGEPLVPPLVYYHQDDPTVREIGHQKLIGRDLMVAVTAKHGEYARNVYLPAGKWVDYNTNEWLSGGGWVADYPTYLDGKLTLPAFARAGAIVPEMYVDAQTKDAFGARKDGSQHNELIVRVFAKRGGTSFTLYEDDGSTLRYDTSGRPQYDARTTLLSQSTASGSVTVTIDAAQGSYAGAANSRDNLVRLIVENAEATRVKLNGEDLPQRETQAAFDEAPKGWRNAGKNLIVAKSGAMQVSAKKTFAFATRAIPPTASVDFVCENGWTSSGEEIYAVGNTAVLGNWDPRLGMKLSPSIHHDYVAKEPRCGPGPRAPIWTGVAFALPEGTALEWKCVKRTNTGTWQWQPGTNNVVPSPARGYAGASRGSF